MQKEEQEGGEDEHRRGWGGGEKQNHQQPLNFCLCVSLRQSFFSKECFLPVVQDFQERGRGGGGGKEEEKKRGWSSHDIIGVNGLPW